MQTIQRSSLTPTSSSWVEYTADTEFQGPYCNTCINGATNGNISLTIDMADENSIPRFIAKPYSVYSTSPHYHQISINGSLTWDGSHQTARFDGNTGSYIHFIVVNEDLLVVTNSKGITFQ